MARKFLVKEYIKKTQKKRKGIHSKNRHTNQKNGKFYSGRKYRGQGR